MWPFFPFFSLGGYFGCLFCLKQLTAISLFVLLSGPVYLLSFCYLCICCACLLVSCLSPSQNNNNTPTEQTTQHSLECASLPSPSFNFRIRHCFAIFLKLCNPFKNLGCSLFMKTSLFSPPWQLVSQDASCQVSRLTSLFPFCFSPFCFVVVCFVYSN